MTHAVEFDLVFISYDEPNAEENFANLMGIAPWAKRVHGVKGFDAAHKAAAALSETEHFITVDGDNIVRPEFFDIDVNPGDGMGCISWSGRNVVNGLRYGNGGLKLWKKDYVLGMKSHETTDDSAAVDFCWTLGYEHDRRVFSDVHCAATDRQAFRAGFREGVKLALDRGRRVEPKDMMAKLHPSNLNNLRIWCSIGVDVKNGSYARWGATNGLFNMLDMEWDHTIIRDYDRLNEVVDVACNDYMYAYSESTFMMGTIEEKTGISLLRFDQYQSKFFKECLDAVQK